MDVLRRIGADIRVELISERDVVEPYGDIKVKGTGLVGTEISGEEIPNLIDEVPLIAVMASLAEGETVIRDAAELRVKESDRISAVVGNLVRLGIDAEEREDGMVIRGSSNVKGGTTVESLGDHRIAMSMAVMGTYCTNALTIEGIGCTDTSYPSFWGDLRHLGGHVEF